MIGERFNDEPKIAAVRQVTHGGHSIRVLLETQGHGRNTRTGTAKKIMNSILLNETQGQALLKKL